MFEEFVIYDNDHCYADCIRWYRRIHGERRTRGLPAPASLMYPDAAVPLVRSFEVQAAPLTDILVCVSIFLLTSRKMDKRPIGSLFSSGVPRLTKFKGKHLTVSGRILLSTRVLPHRHAS